MFYKQVLFLNSSASVSHYLYSIVFQPPCFSRTPEPLPCLAVPADAAGSVESVSLSWPRVDPEVFRRGCCVPFLCGQFWPVAAAIKCILCFSISRSAWKGQGGRGRAGEGG